MRPRSPGCSSPEYEKGMLCCGLPGGITSLHDNHATLKRPISCFKIERFLIFNKCLPEIGLRVRLSTPCHLSLKEQTSNIKVDSGIRSWGGVPEAGNKDGSAHLLCQFMQHSGSAGHTLRGPLQLPLTTSSLSGYMVQQPQSVESKHPQGHQVTLEHKVPQMTDFVAVKSENWQSWMRGAEILGGNKGEWLMIRRSWLIGDAGR